MPIQHKQTYVNDGGSSTGSAKTTTTDYQTQRQTGATGKINQNKKTTTLQKTNTFREQKPAEVNKRSEQVVNKKTVSEKPKYVQSYNDLIEEKKKNDALNVVTAHDDGRKKRIEENPDYQYDLIEFVNQNDNSVMSGRDYKDKMTAYNASMENLYNSFQQLEATYKQDKDYNKYITGYNELVGKYDSLKAEGDLLSGYQANYNESILNEYESNKARMQEIIGLTAQIRNSGGNRAEYDALNSEYLDLKARNEGIQTIYNDVKAWKESDYYNWLLENGEEKEINAYESYLASMADDDNWDHGWFNDRVKTLTANIMNPVYGLLATADITRDLLGDMAGSLLDDVAQDLHQNGIISDESFNKVSAVAKDLVAFEYDNDNNLSQILREYRAKVNREITSGDKSQFELMAGSAIDSAFENYIRWHTLGTYGTFAMAMSTFGDSYYEDIQKGYTPTVALLNSSVKGYITYLSENLSTERYFDLLGSTAGSKVDKLLFATLTDRLISMVPEEMLEEGAEYIGDYFADLLAYSLQPVAEKPQFVPGDLYSAMIQAGLSTTISAGMGAVTSTMLYENTIPQIHNAQEFEQFSAELENIKSLVNLEADVDVKANLQRFIGMAERRIAEFKEISAVAGKIKLASDQPVNLSADQATQAYKDSMAPDAVAMSEEQEKTDIESTEALDYLKGLSRQVLSQKGIIMDPNEYLQMADGKRKIVNTISEAFNKVEGNNIKLVFSTSAPKGGKYETDKKTGQSYIMINPNSDTLVSDIFNHEIVHTLKDTPIWNQLEKIADKIAGDRKEEYKNKLRKAKYKEDVVNEELVAYMLQDAYNTEAFLNEIGKKDKGILRKLYDFAVSLVDTNIPSEADRLAKQIAQAYKNVMGSPRLTSGTAMANNDIDGLREENIRDLRTVQEIDTLYRDRTINEIGDGESDEQNVYNKGFDRTFNKDMAGPTREDIKKSLLGKLAELIFFDDGTVGFKEKTIDEIIGKQRRDDQYELAGKKKAITRMNPRQLIYLTAQGYEDRHAQEFQIKAISDEVKKYYGTLDLKVLEKAIHREDHDVGPMRLVIEKDEYGQLRVTDHNGRHRMWLMVNAGINEVPVVLYMGEGVTADDISNSYVRVQANGYGYEYYYKRGTTLGTVISATNENRDALINEFGPGKKADVYLNKDIQLKDTDDQGRPLSKGQLEYFKNESPLFMKDGHLMTFYHSSPNEFYVFDKDKLGDNTIKANTGYGFFFTPSKEFSERFRNNDYDLLDVEKTPDGKPIGYTMEVYLKSEKPIIHPYYAKGIDDYSPEELDQIVIDWVNATGVAEDALNYLNERIEEYLDEGETAKPGDLYEAFMDVVTDDGDVFSYTTEEREELQKRGYDSIIYYEGTEEDVTRVKGSQEPVLSYIVFEPEQIKSVDNKNPTNDKDIRRNKDIDLKNGLKSRLSPYIETESDELEDIIDQADEQIVFKGDLTPAMRHSLEDAMWEATFADEDYYEGITIKDINKFFRENPIKWSSLKGDNNLSFFEFQKAHPGVRFAKDGDKRWDVVMMEFADQFPGTLDPSEYVTATEFLDRIQEIRESIPDSKVPTMSREEFDEIFERELDEYIKAQEPKNIKQPLTQARLDAIDRQKEMFRNSVKTWVRNYDVLRKKFDIFDQKAFDDAMADVYIEGEITPQTEKELKDSIVKNDFEGAFQGSKADQYVQQFVDESVKYYILEVEYMANQKYRDSIAKNANIVNQAQSRVYDEDYDRAEQAKILEQMVKADKARDYDALYEDVQFIIDNINDKKNILYDRDLKEYNDLVSDGNEELRQAFNNVLEQPVRTAQKQELTILQEYAPKLLQIQEETGIKMYSKEDEAVGWIIEGQKQNGSKYTLEDLQKDFPKKWEQILKLAKFLTENYKPWYDEEIEIKERMYGDIQYQNDIKTAKLENQLQSAKDILEKRTKEFKERPNEKTQAGYAKAQKALDTAQKKLDAQIIKNLEHTNTRKQYTPYRKNYFHHTNEVHFFKNLKAFIKQFANGKVDKSRIPSELAGMTEFLKPKSTNQSYMWKQGKTNYSSSGIASFQHRLQEHANAVAFDPLVNYLRNVESSFRELDADSNAVNYLTWLTKYINNLAGKSNDLDRVLREMSPDGAISILNDLNARAKKNAVYGNLSSALVQTGNFPVGVALAVKNGGKEALQDLVQGTKDYVLDLQAGVKPSDLSTLLALRYFNIDVEDARKTAKLDKLGKFMMEVLDKITAEELWYVFKAQGERLGKANSIAYADEMVDRAIQSRRPEDLPLSQQAKIVKLLAPFQVEVNNQWQVMKDLTKGSAKELTATLNGTFKDGEHKGSAINTMAMIALMITSALMNVGFEKILRRKPLFDPLGTIFEAMKDKELTDAEFIGRVLGEVIGAMPGGQYVPALLGMDEKEAEKFFGESDPSRYGIGNIGISAIAELLTAENSEKRVKALEDILFTYGTPGWGKQLQKFYREGQDFGYIPKYVNGEWRMDPIHYTSTGGVAFVNDPSDVFDYLSGAFTGQYNTKAGKAYVESEFSKLGIETLQDANGKNIPNSKALQVRMELQNYGVYDNVIKQIQNGKMSPQQAGLTDKVINMSEDEFNSAYNAMMIKAEGIANELREAYNWDDEKTSAYEKAVDLEADYANGKKVTDSEALKTRKALEDAGIYDEVLEYIEKNGLEYSDVGLGKRVVNYSEDDFLKAYEKKIGN